MLSPQKKVSPDRFKVTVFVEGDNASAMNQSTQMSRLLGLEPIFTPHQTNDVGSLIVKLLLLSVLHELSHVC